MPSALEEPVVEQVLYKQSVWEFFIKF